MTRLTVLLLAFYMASFNGEDSPAGFSLQGSAGLFLWDWWFFPSPP
jgi:hypothetical protein